MVGRVGPHPTNDLLTLLTQLPGTHQFFFFFPEMLRWLCTTNVAVRNTFLVSFWLKGCVSLGGPCGPLSWFMPLSLLGLYLLLHMDVQKLLKV